ncbi:hypothetical protein MJ579_17630 [Klebsiella pneumoniae]|nr:hypothetical protein MJ579_17630 [Klebsiella pneumoniae]
MLIFCGCVGPERRRLGALCGRGKTASADQLATAGVRLDWQRPARHE